MDCIFCKIVRGEIPSFKFWEDKEHIAILDIFPNTKGMALVLTKKHYDSYAFDMPDDAYSKIMLASKKVGKILDNKLKTKRTALVMEGMGINHIHVKLYPLYGLDEKFKETWSKEKRFFDKYEGYISTILGPEADKNELKKLADKLSH
ncbi:TPA: HIT family protein [Candidatus Woesearchaeota archaeon]|nr:HIT family protein [Candidatus Woesearchaeota archaeon]HIH32590.1 HIT family protein [Candidatus Woesearchaeota archaeon]HIH54754.1 HIT family protein [Candidatus Woesearchaeota archaeon]HIJ02092.1 HIT family protein [Candidatus Woesearchaeota archaeon]HIJ14709.1 HIT family protein [Candidatus Woesearchaeota archaeon]